uniref:Uncharacterized protein n=1 Tax=Trypanosoma congolense (strain IL3000) TaxID=1068625 RepID=G0UJ70_TRYCI|nr:conserved hypothetical protein [Trypanosoma congolense IL3000]
MSGETVRNILYRQLTCPDFAMYCVEHAADPSLKFLFSREDSSERQLYRALLQKVNMGSNRSYVKSVGGKNCCSGRQSGASARVWALWYLLAERFAGAGSSAAVRGPHVPHTFRSVEDLAEFVALVDSAVSDNNDHEPLVRYMRGRLPMTEVFLHIIYYICEDYITQVRRSTSKSFIQLCISKGSKKSIGYSSELSGGKYAKKESRFATASGQNACSTTNGDYVALPDDYVDEETLRKGGTLLYLMNVLLSQHAKVDGGLRYKAVFEYYLLCMVELLAKCAAPGSSVLTFVRETVEAWSQRCVFSGDALQRMRTAVVV